jgi:HPt (histidine-containing phosphotransfer) domain-containing protein
MQSLDIQSSADSIQSKIKSYKTYNDVSQSARELKSSAGNSASKATSQITSQLDKVKDYQKRYLKNPPNSMDQLLGFLGETQGNGSATSRYLRKVLLQAAAKIEPKLAAIVKSETIKALGCSIEQTYKGVSAADLASQPLPLLPQAQGIYIPISSIDIFTNLKTEPETPFGKIFYEKLQPSADTIFKPYGGDESFPMNKQLYQLTESNNTDRSFSQINGKNYLGESGQNLFDLQYSKTNSFGVTGDYYRVILIDREDGSGNLSNNVGEFINDYYSTIKLVDTVDIGANIVNILSGAISFKAQVGIGQLNEQSKFDLLVQRILGLCFDSRREIDVSGVAKVAELDGVDDSFFELTEIDLRNIEVAVSNIQNGVMEFEDCDNVKLPVDADSLIEQLVDLRDNISGQTISDQVAALEAIIDSISQNPDWSVSIPNNFNVAVAIDTNVIKKIPLAVASSVLSPKVLLPLYTLLSVVQSGATYTYNQAVTSANTATSNVNTTVGNAGSDIGASASNVVTNGTEFLKTFKTFSVQVISRINAEFLEVLFEILKRDIINLISSIIQDAVKSRIAKKYAMILRLIQIALIVSQLISDYRKCKSLLDNILLLLNLVGQSLGLKREIPLGLLALSGLLPGISPEKMTVGAIEALQALGIPTGGLPDGSPNLMLQFNMASNKGISTNIAEDGKIEGIGLGGPVTGKFI